MPQVGRRGDLTQEAVVAQDSGELGTDHLDRHTTLVLLVAREKHGGHPASAEQGLDCIAPGQGGGRAV